jgi:hypothetical protein
MIADEARDPFPGKWHARDCIQLCVQDGSLWKTLGWEAQCTLLQLIRKLESNFTLGLGGYSPADAVALMTSGPADFVTVGIEELLIRRVAIVVGDRLSLPWLKAHVPARRAPIPEHVRIDVLDRHGMTCWLCSLPIADRRDLHMDHVIPWSKGGSDDADNLRPAHAKCNVSRGNKEAQ